eukprot:5179154-Amphidinium_carterae.1
MWLFPPTTSTIHQNLPPPAMLRQGGHLHYKGSLQVTASPNQAPTPQSFHTSNDRSAPSCSE